MRKPGQNCVVLDTAPMQNNPCNYFHNTNTREKRLKTESCVHVLSNTCQHFQRSCSWLDLNLTFNCFPFAQMGVCNLLFTFFEGHFGLHVALFPTKIMRVDFFWYTYFVVWEWESRHHPQRPPADMCWAFNNIDHNVTTRPEILIGVACYSLCDECFCSGQINLHIWPDGFNWTQWMAYWDKSNIWVILNMELVW